LFFLFHNYIYINAKYIHHFNYNIILIIIFNYNCKYIHHTANVFKMNLIRSSSYVFSFLNANKNNNKNIQLKLHFFKVKITIYFLELNNFDS